MRWIDGDSARFPRLLRFLAFHAAVGAVIGIALATALLASNVAGLCDLLLASDVVYLGAAMLFGSFALTFASASMGTAVMLLPDKPRRR